jgi:hypothetical protein
VARRRPATAPALAEGAELLLPRELTYFDPDGGNTFREHHRVKADWFRAHGIDPGDWSQVHPILVASRRAHARTKSEVSALDRHRLILSGEPAEAR